MRKVVVVLWFFVSTLAAYGQTALATITGTVADATGAVVADVAIEVRNVVTGQLFTTSTSGANRGLYNGGFGTILSTAGTTGQRAGTLVARFTF